MFRLVNFLFLLMLMATAAGCVSVPKVFVLDDPLSPEEHLKLGRSYEQNKELDLAEREYRLAQPLPEASLALANLAFMNKDYFKAERYYKQAMTNRRQYALAANNLAWLWLTMNRNLPQARDLALNAVKWAGPDDDVPQYKDTLNEIERRLAGGVTVPVNNAPEPDELKPAVNKDPNPTENQPTIKPEVYLDIN